ncbi:MAG TPA: tetratricopeptide repeat protein, partial [Anaerolineae bacterium]|nr:tetratricopeptide repeat protein [Anaerolineae bacterium]
YYMARAEFHTMLNIAQQMADTAERWGDQPTFPLHRTKMGVAYCFLGDFESARAHLEVAAARYDRDLHRSLALVVGQDMGVVTLDFLAFTLWDLGYPDRALERAREALDLAQTLDHPSTLAMALENAGRVHSFRGEAQEAMEWAEAAIEVAQPRGLMLWEVLAMRTRGWALVRQGAAEEGEAELRRALAAWESIGSVFVRGEFLSWLAEACAKTGRIEEGLALLAEALAFVEETDERASEAEMHRLRGELLLLQGSVPSSSRVDETGAEAEYRTAIEVARRQQAKSWELRATTSLSRLLRQQGKREEALHMLGEIYGWFTEGFGTADLREAKALLDGLRSPE